MRPTALVFLPHLRTLGGGERFMFEVARAVATTHDVHLMAPQQADPGRLARLGFPPLPVEIGNARRFVVRSRSFDLAIMQTSNPPVPSFARRSLLVVQFPNQRLEHGWRGLYRRWGLRRYDTVVAYSEFAAKHVADRWGRSAAVVHPPVHLLEPTPAKQPVIVTVGRLGAPNGFKRHDVLLEAWRQLQPSLPGWEFIIAGAAADSAQLDELKAAVADVGKCRLMVDATADELAEVVQRATFYWHAAGFDRSDDRPDLAEHFGISTVEAMSAGCVPLVYDDGGQREIVTPGTGVRWRRVPELVAATTELANDPAKVHQMAAAAVDRAKGFGPDHFDEALLALIR